MMEFNVFEWPFSKRYYLTHPWKWFKELGSNLQAAWMRATRGYCYRDVWNWSDWFLEVVPPMLQHLAEHGCAYPGMEPFETPEKWHDWLEDIAASLISCREKESEKRNQYYQDFMDSFLSEKKRENDNVISTPLFDKELAQKYFARDKEIAAENAATLQRVFAELASHFYKIWD